MKIIRYDEIPKKFVDKYGILFCEDHIYIADRDHQIKIMKGTIRMTIEYDCEIVIKTLNADIIINKIDYNVEVNVR